MRRLFFLIPAIVFGVLLFVFLRGLDPARDPRAVPSALIGKAAPAFALPGLAPDQPGVTNADFAGKTVIVNFFASWCVPCRAEHPTLAALARQSGVPVYGIAYKDDPTASSALLSELGNPYRAVGADRTGMTAIDFGVYGVPETFVIDSKGVIRFRQAGPLDPETVTKRLLPLLAEVGQ